MKFGKNIILATCSLTMLGFSITSAASAGENLSLRSNAGAGLSKPIMRRAERRHGSTRLGTHTRGGNAETVPQIKTAKELKDFIAMCDINGGGISSEPDPDNPDGVILDCQVY